MRIAAAALLLLCAQGLPARAAEKDVPFAESAKGPRISLRLSETHGLWHFLHALSVRGTDSERALADAFDGSRFDDERRRALLRRCASFFRDQLHYEVLDAAGQTRDLADFQARLPGIVEGLVWSDGEDRSQPYRLRLGSGELEFELLAATAARGGEGLEVRPDVDFRRTAAEQVVSIRDDEAGARWYRFRLRPKDSAGPGAVFEAYVDGHSELHVGSGGVYWKHLKDAKPGRHGGADEPTYVDGRPWHPVWEGAREDARSLRALLSAFAPAYEELVWKPSLPRLRAHRDAIAALSHKADFADLYARAAAFYGAQYRDPVVVALVPIPMKGGALRVPLLKSLVSMEVTLNDDERPEDGYSVIFHEVCHLLYRNKPAELAKGLEEAFGGEPYPVDEAMALSIGVWVGEKLSGAPDARWRENCSYEPLICACAGTLYPRVAERLAGGGTIDGAFLRAVRGCRGDARAGAPR